MKKLIYLLAIVAIVAACKNNEPDSNTNQQQTTTRDLSKLSELEALGTIAVPTQDFTKADVRAEAIINGASMDLNLYDVKFAANMPVTIDMVIPNITIDSITPKKIGFSGANIVPTMKGSPFEKYTTGELKGYITPDSLCFTTPLGGIGTTYKGLLQ